MKTVISTFLILISVVTANAQISSQPASLTVGFLSGSQFSSSHIQGAVTVYCSNNDSVTFTCYDTVLDPNNYDYFAGPPGVVADELTLNNLRPDGGRREKTVTYNYVESRSEDAFNLWISSPFQRPLLALGKNNVDYLLLSRGKIVNQGTFIVNVTQGEPRTCAATHYNSNDPNDCKSQYTVCQRYFEQYNYCR